MHSLGILSRIWILIKEKIISDFMLTGKFSLAIKSLIFDIGTFELLLIF